MNASNGTAGFSIPVPISPGRNGFSPALSLSYNSGSGNSAYGLGWSIQLPTIQRKTDKQLPRYRDSLEEDTFMFSGAEDLVPFLKDDGTGNFVPIEKVDNGYKVKRYRPRIEGGFARIEKIEHSNHGVYWKVTTRENVTTFYGRGKNARIANPEEETQIFQWMPEFSYDDKGNWISYEYKKENLENVPNSVYEKNRKSGQALFTNTYLKSIKYGNRKAYYSDQTKPYDLQMPATPEDEEHFFEVVFDYGEHRTKDEFDVSEIPTYAQQRKWSYRQDAYSSYRAGFEIRTNRRCFAVLMFHSFKDEKQLLGYHEDGSKIETPFGQNYLVRSLDFEHEPAIINGQSASIDGLNSAEVVYLKSIAQNGYIQKEDGSYSKKSLPLLEFTYEKLNWNKDIKIVGQEDIVNAPVGLTNNYQWVDLYGEGISGILTEQGEAWHYKSRLYKGKEDTSAQTYEIGFSNAQEVLSKPSFIGLSNGILSIQDLNANGEKQVVVNSDALEGYFELLGDQGLQPFIPFQQVSNIDLQDPNTRLLDLNGNGQPDIVVTEENVFVWYPSDGKQGHRKPEYALKALDEENGPAIVFADQEETIFLADVAGDGLTDIVRIRNGEICYWANKGYGKFSAKVNMGNAPLFDAPDLFNPAFLHLADVSGTGATDIIYLGQNEFKAFINLSGNSWSDAHEIDPFFPIDRNSQLSVVDLLGTGTSCIVWSSDLPAHSRAPMRYIDLMDSKKPHVLIHYKNNIGKETSIQYKSSTHFYLKDKLDNKPWVTKLPFPVQVVSKLTVEEKITDVRFTNEYIYHHGYYDHPEREFRGFGMVEQIDSEHYEEWSRNNAANLLEKSEVLYQKPVLTKSWFHTGAFLDRERILTHFKNEYWLEEYNRAFPSSTLTITEPELPDAHLSDTVKALMGDEYREALRACKGMVLRQETFALDAPDNPTDAELQTQMKPYTVATHNCNVQLLQPRGENEYGVFLVTESEAMTITYERDETDPRISHTLNTEIDELGNILESASVVYGRRQAKADADFQSISANITDFSEDVLNNDAAQKTQLQNAFDNNLQAAKDEQTKTHLIYTQNSFAKYNDGVSDFDDIDLSHAYRLRLLHETKTYEFTGFVPSGGLFKLNELRDALSAASEIGYHESPSAGKKSRLIEHIKSKYLDNDLKELNFGFFDSLGLPSENYQLAYTPDLVTAIFQKGGVELQAEGVDISNFIEAKGKFSNINGKLWIRSGFAHYKVNVGEAITDVQKRFYSPIAFEDPLGGITSVVYDAETFTNTTRNNDGYYLFVKSITDAIDNKMQIDLFNYRTLSADRVIDVNGNPSSVLTDELGLVKALATEGNGVYADGSRTAVTILEQADSLFGLKAYTEDEDTYAITQLFGATTNDSTHTNELRQLGNNFLKQASARFVYDFDTYQNTGIQPAVVASIVREEHFAVNNSSKIQFSFEYSDGFGNMAMTKVQAEPGLAYYMENGQRKEKNTGPDLRWIGNGRTILNNKGKPVKQFEPYFSTNFLFEDDAQLVEIGVSPVIHYDSIGRIIKTELPNGTFTSVDFDSWSQFAYDENDNILTSDWYDLRTNPTRIPELTALGKDATKEKEAALASESHANTPSSLCLDSLGRPVLKLANNGKDGNDKDRLYATFIQLDIEGNVQAVRDARDNTVMSYKYDMLGHRVYQNSMDAGMRWVLNNLMGNLIHRWDSRNHVFIFSYDVIQRPTSIKVEGGDGTALDNTYEYIEYGEGKANQYQNNLRGQVFQKYDTAGRIRNMQFDFKGNVLRITRELNANYKDVPNWTTTNRNAPNFDPELTTYDSQFEYDGLNRAVKTTTADNSITTPVFNEAGLLEQVKVTQTGIAEKLFVKDIDYDAKRQRKKIIYGDRNNNNLVTTTYDYDEKTFRLIHLKTVKSNGELLQDLYYTFDPVGNIMEMEDKAIPVKFFNNQKIEGKAKYNYDALYRLKKADGREHSGQAINFGQCDNWRDQNFLKLYSPNDDMAWRKYTQKYTYDPVGNILETNHDSTGGNWTRQYEYEIGNNRLKETQVGGQTYIYTHHSEHGFIKSLPHLSLMQWNFKDELQATSKRVVCNDNNPSEITYYVYDSNGQRIRKITEVNGGGSKKEERVYLGGVEIFLSYTSNSMSLARWTLHVMDDTRRIAMVDTKILGNDGTDPRTVRFQFSNHLGSACLETDDMGNVISFEEYHPYGTTAYRAFNQSIKTKAKRYKYTDKERDEETGLYYYGARYYLPYLGRWIKPDPTMITDGLNVYSYVNGKPISYKDPNGLWELPSWETVAVVSAAVVVGTVVTVATAGAAAPVVAAAVASVGVTGTAATVATGVVVGAAAGAAGGAAAGAAGETTRQAVHGEDIDVGRIADEAGTGAAIGTAVGAAIPLVAAGAGAVATTTAGTAVVGAARSTAQSVASSTAGRAVSATAQRVASSGGGRAVAAVARQAARPVQAIQSGAERVGTRVAANIPGRGGEAAQRVIATRAAAVSEANSVQGLSNSQRPNTVGALKTRSGNTATAGSVRGNAPQLGDDVTGALDDIAAGGRVGRGHGRCAEPQCLSELLDVGEDLRGGVSASALARSAGNPNHGKLIPACATCEQLLPRYGVVDANAQMGVGQRLVDQVRGGVVGRVIRETP